MVSLFNLFRSKPEPPARVPTDTIIPLHSYDDTEVNRAMIVDFSMKFDDVLDVQKVVGALERLLAKPGWRKLGARLRLNNHGKLEYHVPAEYTATRPAVNLTHVKHDVPISQHSQASKLLSPSSVIRVSPSGETLVPLLKPENCVKQLEDFIYTDRPQFQLHVVSFEDATLVTLSWCHTLLDAMGRNVLLRSWTAMLEGREEDVPEFYGYDFDPMASFGAPQSRKLEDDDAEKEEEFVLKNKTLSGWNMFRFVFNYVWELVVYRKEEMRCMCIPAAFFKKLRQEAMDDLASVPPATIVLNTSDPANPKPFLSDGDILCAWWTRLMMSCQPWAASNPTRTICLMNVFGMRNLLEDTEPKLLEKGKAYISNCVTTIQTFITVKELLSLPLGVIAARIRKDLVTQSTRPQMDALARLNKASIAATGRPPVFGAPDMVISAFSNWAKGKMFETDFSAAVVKEGGKPHRKGKPTCIHVNGTAKKFSVRNSGPCLGKDGEGNYWVGGSLRTETWKNILKTVEDMS